MRHVPYTIWSNWSVGGLHFYPGASMQCSSWNFHGFSKDFISFGVERPLGSILAQASSQESAQAVTDPTASCNRQWKVDSLINSAFNNIKDRNLAKAREQYREACSLAEPTDPKPLMLMARFEGKCGDTVAARKLYQAALERQADDSVLLSSWGFLEARQGSKSKARELLQQSLRIKPNDAYSIQGLANLEAGQGRRPEARGLYRLGAKQNPDDAGMFTPWAIWEWKWGRQSYARKLFSHARRICVPDAPLLAAWAELEAKEANSSRARKLFTEALDVKPTHMQSLLGLAALEGRAGHPTKANGLYARAMQIEPRNIRILTAAAQNLITQDIFGEAEVLLERVLEINAFNGHALSSLGSLKLREGKREEAEALFHKGSKDRNQKGRMLCFEALAQSQEFDFDVHKARQTFDAALVSCESSPSSRILREFALFEKRQKNLEAASRLFERAHNANRNDGRTILLWALLEKRRGNLEAAKAIFQKGMRITKQNPIIHQLWGLAELEDDNVNAARRIFQNARKTFPRYMPLLQELALLEQEEANVTEARRLFQEAEDPKSPVHPPLIEAWIAFEKLQHNYEVVETLRERYGPVLARLKKH